MAHCTQCGATLAAGARYCGSCGSALTANPPPPGPAPPAAALRKDTSGAEAIILIGAILAALLPFAIALAFLFFGAIMAAVVPFWGAIPGSIFALISVFFILGGLIFGAAGLWARNVVRDGDPQRGGAIAGIVGLVACLVGNIFGGLVLILGGLIAYTAK